MAVDVYYSSYDCNHQEEEEEDDDEEYIDMEVNPLYKSNNNFPCPPSPPSKEDEGHHHQFEFQMSSTLTGTSSSLNQQSLSTTSPADELFYMGKLLPLHLPPRLHTIESILQNRASFRSTPSPPDDDAVSTPPSLVAGTPVASTPFLSCNASPVESCHVSGELNINGEEYLRDYREHEHQLMVEISGDEFESEEEEEEESRRSWMRKLSMIKHVLLGSKLKGSRAYLRNLLSKSVCSHKSSASVVNNNEKRAGGGSKKKKKKNEAAVADSSRREIIETKQHDADESGSSSSKICHRRSFSGVFKRRSASMAKISAATSTLSSFSSSSTLASCTGNNSIYNKELKRSNGTTTTNSNNIAMECPIQGAIAHCKRSHHQEEVKMVRSRKALSEVGLFGFQDRS